MKNLLNAISLALVLLAFWLILSGMFQLQLLFFGVLSVAFVTYLSRRMGVLQHQGEAIHSHIGFGRYYRYWFWLLGAILKSSLHVCRHILDPRCSIYPTMLRFRSTQKTDIGRVNFANSITRTPGTVTIDIYQEKLLVHALTEQSAADLQSGDMDRRVSALEEDR